MIKISLVNQAAGFKDADLPALANALAIQVKRDFFPVWGIGAELFYAPAGHHAPADHWVMALLDNADVAGALGYHDVTPAGQPLGKIFVATTLADGGLVSVTASHELLESLADPTINICTEIDDGSGAPSKFFAMETGDPVESDNLGYDITIPSGWAGAGTIVRVSDFVTPNYFRSGSPGPWDFAGHLKAPLTLTPGGYQSFLDLGNLAAGWQQTFARETSAAARMAARPRPGSRRSRRALPRSQWLRSTYAPGTEAIPAA